MPRAKKPRLKQRSDGRYACRYKDKWFMGATEAEALAAREEYKRVEALHKPEAVYFSNYAQTWLHAYKAHLTAAPYNQHVRIINRFIDIVGDKPLENVVPSDISAFYQAFSGYSASYIHDARDTVKGLFRAAVADGLIANNPAETITPPKGSRGTHRAITPDERRLIHTVSHRLRPAVMIMLYAGLRRGEALSIDVDRDIDFDKKRITVRQAVRFGSDGQPITCSPKTAAGIRVIPLLDILAKELEGIHGPLCVSASGKPMSEIAFRRAWESYLYALGEAKNGCSKRWSKGPWVPVEIRPHDLRHSYATMLYDAGVSLKTAMQWMGHADQTMTMQIYTHLTEMRRSEDEKALREAEKSFFVGETVGKLNCPS